MREVLLAIGVTSDGRHLLRVPRQRVGRTALVCQPSDATLLEIRSHHRLPAVSSSTYHLDERRLRLYAVVGRLDAELPEAALRLGAYGHFLSLPFGVVFAGEPTGIRDLGTDGEFEQAYEFAGALGCPWPVDESGVV